MSNIGEYIAENLRLSFTTWGVGSRMGSLVGALIALAFALFTLVGGAAVGFPISVNHIPSLLGVWFIFLVILVTPYRMWAAQREEVTARDQKIADMQACLTERAATQGLVSALWELRDAGVKIRNERITADAEPSWMIRYESWRRDTLDMAERLSPNLRRDLQVLDRTGEVPAGVNPVSVEHARAIRIISEITKRLADYLREHYP